MTFGVRYAKTLCVSSVHKQPGRPYYFCAYYSAEGKRLFRSTETKDKRQAEGICKAWQKAEWLKRTGKLNPERAREVIAEGVASAFAASGDDLPRDTIRGWAERWLQAKELETQTGTYLRYKGILTRFVDGLGAKADKDLSTLSAADIQSFRDKQAKMLSHGSANLSLKILRVWLGAAFRKGFITVNAASQVDRIKHSREEKRRPFTLAEIKKILGSVKGTEWEGMILFACYTGQRLGDLAHLTWQSIDLSKKQLAFVSRKTERRMHLPLAKPLLNYLLSLPSTDDPKAFVFPKSAKIAQKRVGTLSNQFYEILTNVGYATVRSCEPTKKGRGAGGARREVSELSFHSLRHSATTMLKAAGVSDVIAREIIGHESEAVSRNYTHFDAEDLREAIEKLPDVTQKTTPRK